MAVRNEGGQDVDYDVEPSEPGGGGGGNLVANSAGKALLFSSLGATFAAVGCLTGLGGQGLVLAGLGLLAAGLVFQGITLDRARRLAAAAPMARIVGTSGKKLLKNQEEHSHTFVAGTWVNFWLPGTMTKLAQSPQIHDANARVILRRRQLASTGEGAAASGGGEYFVEVIPSVT